MWFKSSHSEPNGGQCVEVNIQKNAIGIRDSKDPEPEFWLSPEAFKTLLKTVVDKA